MATNSWTGKSTELGYNDFLKANPQYKGQFSIGTTGGSQFTVNAKDQKAADAYSQYLAGLKSPAQPTPTPTPDYKPPTQTTPTTPKPTTPTTPTTPQQPQQPYPSYPQYPGYPTTPGGQYPQYPGYPTQPQQPNMDYDNLMKQIQNLQQQLLSGQNSAPWEGFFDKMMQFQQQQLEAQKQQANTFDWNRLMFGGGGPAYNYNGFGRGTGFGGGYGMY